MARRCPRRSSRRSSPGCRRSRLGASAACPTRGAPCSRRHTSSTSTAGEPTGRTTPGCSLPRLGPPTTATSTPCVPVVPSRSSCPTIFREGQPCLSPSLAVALSSSGAPTTAGTSSATLPLVRLWLYLTARCH
uniref:Uncharacterized protein n=1 Tax=Arundo donax TaxID=35708 RepID=A0A0A9BZJ4_ARUDO